MCDGIMARVGGHDEIEVCKALHTTRKGPPAVLLCR
jgi:hypothetical protein